MTHTTIKQLESFSNSSINSDAEQEFAKDTLRKYFEHKLGMEYAKELKEEYGIEKKNNVNKPQSSSKIWIFLLIGFTLLIAIIAGMYLNKSSQSTDILYASNDLYYDMDFVTRGDNSANLALVKLQQAYDDKDFSQVISEFETLQKSDVLSNEILFSVGIAYSNVKQYDKATAMYNELLQSPESKYSYHQETRWFMALNYQQNGEIEETISILNEINMGDSYYENAQNLIEKLEN